MASKRKKSRRPFTLARLEVLPLERDHTGALLAERSKQLIYQGDLLTEDTLPTGVLPASMLGLQGLLAPPPGGGAWPSSPGSAAADAAGGVRGRQGLIARRDQRGAGSKIMNAIVTAGPGRERVGRRQDHARIHVAAAEGDGPLIIRSGVAVGVQGRDDHVECRARDCRGRCRDQEMVGRRGTNRYGCCAREGSVRDVPCREGLRSRGEQAYGKDVSPIVAWRDV